METSGGPPASTGPVKEIITGSGGQRGINYITRPRITRADEQITGKVGCAASSSPMPAVLAGMIHSAIQVPRGSGGEGVGGR